MTPKTVKDAILKAGENGRIFTAIFIKRTTGERRTMTCRLGVKKHVKGVGMAYKPEDHNLIGVYDMQYAAQVNPEKAYRMIDLESVMEIHSGGEIIFLKNT